MNRVAAWLIVLGIGAVFLALEFIYPYYRASIFGYSVEPLVNPDQSKARAAVSRLLFDPNSAEFNDLREVEAQGLQYVCGDVDAKDRSGSYSGPREFVYDVKPDNARIDDSEQIAKPHDAYKPCPENIESSLPPSLDLEAALKVVKILKVIPKPGLDPQLVASLGSLLATKPSNTAAPEQDLQVGLSQFRRAGDGAAATDLESGLGRFQAANTLAQSAASDGATTQPHARSSQADVSAKADPKTAAPKTADLKNERERRGDHPLAGWPTFPSDDPLARPVRKRTPEQAITLASGVKARWKSFKAGRSASRPNTSDIEEALRALLAIAPNSPEFPQAWALFVSLRQIDREAGAMESRPRPAAGSSRSRG